MITYDIFRKDEALLSQLYKDASWDLKDDFKTLCEAYDIQVVLNRRFLNDGGHYAVTSIKLTFLSEESFTLFKLKYL